MKNLAALIVLLSCSSAHADCQEEWLTFQSPTQQLSVRYEEGCYHGALILSYWREGTKQDAPSGEISFDQECPVKKRDKSGEVVEFSCRKNGVSPLAGATYRFKLMKTTIVCDGVVGPDEDHTFICVKGCGKKTPAILTVPFGEGCS